MAAYDFIIDTGTVVTDTASILSDVQGEFQNALGATINLASSTPQGTLIAAETIARTGVMKNNADVANTINPDLSYGTFLDAICNLLGITRGSNQSTVGQGALLTGNANTSIAAGSRVQTANGDIFSLVSAVTIPIGGSIRANIQSQAFGNIPLPVGTLTILDGTIGWATAAVDGTTTVVPGTIALSDPQLKIKRNQQLAMQGVGSSGAIAAAITQVSNVTSAMVVENNTGAAGSVNGITFTLGNAIWVCVAGNPDQSEVAAALYAAHQGGCPWDFGGAGMGNPVNSPTGVTTNDPVTGLPYIVKWTKPIMFDVYVNITVHQNQSVSSPVQAVQNAIMNYVNGLEQGEPGLVIGADVSAFEMAGAVARQLPGMYVKNCAIAAVLAGSAAPSYPSGYSLEVVLNPYQQGQLAIGNITVTLV